jgi:acetamidase/formamidase
MGWPRLETADSITALVSGKPLEWSARQAWRELLEWVVEDYEIERAKAALLLAMVATAGICQISNSDYTAYCVAPRDVLEPYRRR